MQTLPLNLIQRFFICAFLLVTSSRASAQAPVTNDDRVRIIYAGMKNDHLIFYVQVDNFQQERINCRLLDQEMNTLFDESFTSAKFEKKFLVLKENINLINFRVAGKSFTCEKDFNIRTRIIEEVTVSQSK